MVIKKNTKYGQNPDAKPIKLNLDLSTYDIFCRYLLQNPSMLRMDHMINLRKLIDIIDRSTYENDAEKLKRFNFIYKALEARIDNHINDRELILSYINGGLTFKIEFLDYNHLDLTSHEMTYIHSLVSETLQYQFVYNNVDNFQDICSRFMTSEYSNRGNIVKEFEGLVDNMKNQFRMSRVNDNAVNMQFSLRDGVFENAIVDTYNIITNPSRRLICGMQGLNEMTGGGFEAGRVYMLLGTTGVGKSISLLNLIYQIKRYNKFYKTKDPTKVPCICLLTMENTIVETITRLFDLVIEGSNGMANYDVNEVIHRLKTEGELTINDSSPIDIVIRYKANKSVDTSYLYTLCDELDDDGYECICMVQDHVKRIRSIYNSSDIRIELGDIVNEFKVFAAEKDIPIITNSHLNREAAKMVEESMRHAARTDTTKALGKSNVGESMLMMDNIDCAIIINLDWDKDQNRYMCYNLIKMRDKTNRTYIVQPFAPGSTIRMVEDVGGIPQFKETLHGTMDIRNNATCIKMSSASSMNDSLESVIDKDDLDDNTFSMNQYNLDVEVKDPKPVPTCPVIFEKSKISNNIQEFAASRKRQPVSPIIFDTSIIGKTNIM